VILQMRTYELFDDTREAFHARFRDHAVRIFERHGFSFVAGWERRHEGRLQFVYVLKWLDEDTMQRCWAAFMADDEWAEIKRRSAASAAGPLVGEIDDCLITPVDYLPSPFT
jgi:hypothetical protein